jgi:hypothetical protein
MSCGDRDRKRPYRERPYLGTAVPNVNRQRCECNGKEWKCNVWPIHAGGSSSLAIASKVRAKLTIPQPAVAPGPSHLRTRDCSNSMRTSRERPPHSRCPQVVRREQGRGTHTVGRGP